jgi:hypothetical protein
MAQQSPSYRTLGAALGLAGALLGTLLASPGTWAQAAGSAPISAARSVDLPLPEGPMTVST